MSNLGKTLVLYVFHEVNNRVLTFFDKGLFKDDNVDFVVICNNRDIKLNLPDYVKVVIRDNKGFDFGGWSEGLLSNDLYKNYDYFIFVNSSVLGPFLPSYYKGKWTDIFIDGLVDDVKLYGITINCERDPIFRTHIQSYLFSMDKKTLEFLIINGIFDMNILVNTYEDLVENKEMLMSRLIIERGWNIGCLCDYYKNVDFRFKDKQPKDYDINFLSGIMDAKYRNIMWNEYQLVFIKGNRFGIE